MKIHIVLLLLLVSSCGIRKTKMFDSEKCSELSYMYISDQATRFLSIRNTELLQDSVLIDSQKISDFNKGFLMRSLFRTFLRNDKNIDSTFKKFNSHPINKDYARMYLEECKRIWEEISIIDNENSKILIAFTKKYGYPDNDRFKDKCDNASAIYLVFVHNIFDDKVWTLVDKEYKAGRIPKKDYSWIVMRRNPPVINIKK